METITLNGKEYTKVSLLAKKYKYTTDYIGQLCRAEKVDAELVGRTWYVDEDTLKKHKKSRYSKTRSNDKSTKDASKIKISRIRVEPVITNRGTKLLKNKAVNFARRIDWKPAKYEFDETELIPDMKQSKKLVVDLADSAQVKIREESEKTDFIPEDLPTVSLKGNIKVSSADMSMEDDLSLLNKGFNSVDVSKKDLLPDDNNTPDDNKTSPPKSVDPKIKDSSVEQNLFLHKFLKTTIALMIFLLIGLLLALILLNFSASNSDDFFNKGIQFSTDFL